MCACESSVRQQRHPRISYSVASRALLRDTISNPRTYVVLPGMFKWRTLYGLVLRALIFCATQRGSARYVLGQALFDKSHATPGRCVMRWRRCVIAALARQCCASRAPHIASATNESRYGCRPRAWRVSANLLLERSSAQKIVCK